jgi:uncharacterized protein
MIENVEIPASKHPEGVQYSPLGFVIVSLIIVFVLYQIVGGAAAVLISGGDVSKDNVSVARIITMIAQFILLLLPTLWLIKRQHTDFANVLKWRIPTASEIILSVIGMAALLQVAEGYIYFQDKIPIPESIAPYVEMMKRLIEDTYRVLVETSTVPELIFVIAVAAITPAICEEILFRGLVQKNLSLASTPVQGFLFTGIIFGLYHFNPFLAVPLVALGVYFSFLQYRSQSLIIPILAHLVNNTFSVVAAHIYGFDQSDIPSILKTESGSVSDISVLSTSAIFLVVFVVIVMFYIRVTDQVGKKPFNQVEVLN